MICKFSTNIWLCNISLNILKFQNINQATKFVWILIKGRNPASFYVCTGKYPKELDQASTKMNYPLSSTVTLSFVLYIFVLVRYNLYFFHFIFNLQKLYRLKLYFKPLNVITLVQTKNDNINRVLTFTDDFF